MMIYIKNMKVVVPCAECAAHKDNEKESYISTLKRQAKMADELAGMLQEVIYILKEQNNEFPQLNKALSAYLATRGEA